MLVLFTDTDCDVTPKMAKEMGYKLISMPYIIDDINYYPYSECDDFDMKAFYDELRKGVMPKTCAISPGEYVDAFEPVFKEGNDILYVHFSKAMSGTFDAMNIALEELYEKYPGRKFYSIDTKGITINSYIIVREVARLFKEGKSLEEVLAWANEEVDHFATYFYADDLKFFARSGRVSNFTAIMGSLIGIHPILHMASDGMMKSVSKARGKMPTLTKIVDYVTELGLDVKKYGIVIGHSDAKEIAERLASMIKAKLGDDLDIEYVEVNPTAGSHCGPGNVGVSFHAIHR